MREAVLLTLIWRSQKANSSQWCADWYADKLPGGSVRDPVGPVSDSCRVLRGGGWGGSASYCRSALRLGYVLGFRGNILGFRLALSSVR